jgi:hypothetical protein
LALIQQPPAELDLGLSEQMRESVLASIANERADEPAVKADTMRHAFESVSATIEDGNSPFTAGERALMRELLARLASDS